MAGCLISLAPGLFRPIMRPLGNVCGVVNKQVTKKGISMRYGITVLLLLFILTGCKDKDADKKAPAVKAAPAKKAEAVKPRGHMIKYSIKDTFDFVKESVLQAISDRGMVISSTSHVSNMLQRTAKAVGAKKNIYIKAESLAFCSASLSRKMMEADPHNIVFCPYNISIYVLVDDPKVVWVAYRRPQLVGSDASKKALQAIDDLLNGIIREALEIE
jgi:uncharacterized protein (DUF302 family)